MSKLIDETGNTYGMLTVVSHVGHKSGGQALWRCKCKCGNEKSISGQNLRYGVTVSCGCLSQTKEHRDSNLRQYLRRSWDRTGSLYGVDHADIRELMDPLRVVCLPKTWDTAWSDADTYNESCAMKYVGRKGPDISGLYPMTVQKHEVIRCDDCKKYRHRVFACVHCMSVTCRICVGTERHICSDMDSFTLETIGRLDGVTRERIRQIEASAFENFKKRWTIMFGKADVLRH